jgi:hypothetical protein
VFNAGDPPLQDLMGAASTTKISLFGSHCTMLQIFENALRWFHTEMEGVVVRTHRGMGLFLAFLLFLLFFFFF